MYRATKHTVKASAVTDGGVEFVIEGRCGCGVGVESGLLCSHELAAFRNNIVTESWVHESVLQRWYQRYDELATEKIV